MMFVSAFLSSLSFIFGHVFSQIIPRKGVTGGEKKNVIVVQTVRRCGGGFHFCPRGGRGAEGEGLTFFSL